MRLDGYKTADIETEIEIQTNPPRIDDMALLIRRLCRVIAKHDANNTVREQALDYLHRKGLGGSPLRANKVATP